MVAEIIPINSIYALYNKSMDECEPFLQAQVIELDKTVPKAIEKLVQKLLIKMGEFQDKNKEDPFHYEPFQNEMHKILDSIERYGGFELQNKLSMITINYILEFQDFFRIRRRII